MWEFSREKEGTRIVIPSIKKKEVKKIVQGEKGRTRSKKPRNMDDTASIRNSDSLL